MIYTVLQSGILRALSERPCMDMPQLKWLMRLEQGAPAPRTVKAVEQLARFHQIYQDSGAYHLPGRQVDRGMLLAVHVMKKVAGNELPEYAAGGQSCQLCFQLGSSFYRVISVPPGKERLVQVRTERETASETLFYCLEKKEQIPLLCPEKNAVLVLPDEREICLFLRQDC